MKLNKGIQRRLVVYFSIVTLLLTFVTVAMTLSVGKTNWPNPDGKVSIGRVTTNTSYWALTPEADSLAYAVACNEYEEVTVMPNHSLVLARSSVKRAGTFTVKHSASHGPSRSHMQAARKGTSMTRPIILKLWGSR